MSVYTVTIDHLMQLGKAELEYALRIFQKELDGALDLLADPEVRKDEVMLRDLEYALTLRKVVILRLEELAQEAGPQLLLNESSTALAA